MGLETLEPRLALAAGTWTALAHAAPNSIGTMELLSDGTVMAQQAGTTNAWYRLTPDASGSYVNGAWSQLASMSVPRLYFGSNVLPDGRVFVLGGEYYGFNGLHNTNTGEIYNPLTDTWSSIASYKSASFGDGSSIVLNDGRVLAAGKLDAATYIYDPATDSWSDPQPKLYGDINDEESLVKLPDGSILTYDIWNNPPGVQHSSQRFDPSTMTWIPSGSVPVQLDDGHEIGPALLLPDGRVFHVGANSNTALYTPSSTPGGSGTWDTGPVLPPGFGANDAPAAVMPNGHVLIVAGTIPGSNSPTHVFEFDPIASSLTDVTPTTPDLSHSIAFPSRMLMLPSGQVLFTYGSSQLYVYTPSGVSDQAWKPTINGYLDNGNGTFTLAGTQLNGLSAGASYGDDAQMDTNYPIIELKAQDGSGKVYFARTFHWSSTGVATGGTPVSTDFSVPPTMPYGTYSLSVVANGIASDPVDFTGGTVGPTSDLAVSYLASGTGTEGSNIVYNLKVTNNGPTSATSVVLNDTLGANLKYVSAAKSQGTFTQSGSLVTFNFGTIAAGQSATATVTAQALEDGNLTSNLSVTSGSFDVNASNNTALVTTVVPEAPINVSAPTTVNSKKVNNQTVATFTHAGGFEPTSAFAATINWGDGSTSAGAISKSGSSYAVKGSHTYSSNGKHTVTTTVVETEPSASPAPVSLADLVTTIVAAAPANVRASIVGVVNSAMHGNAASASGNSPIDAATVDRLVTQLTDLTTGVFANPALADHLFASLDRAAASDEVGDLQIAAADLLAALLALS